MSSPASTASTASVPATSPAAPIVGIDLGTTYSLVAVANWPLGGGSGGGSAADAAKPRVLLDDSGKALCPSVVRFRQDGPPIVGPEARASAVEFATSTVSSVKRLMGRSRADAGADVDYLPYAVVEGEGRTARVQMPWGQVISPQEVSALVLSRLREQASRALGVEVRKAVVTVPAYFDDAQRQATRDAGRLAGLEVVRIVNEPTAAALAYGLGIKAAGGSGSGRKDEPRTVVIYDFGGGTFDVSVLRLTPGEPLAEAGVGAEAGAGGEELAAEADFFQVLATAGDTHLGGDDVDRLLVETFTREIGEKFGIAGGGGAETYPPATRRALAELAERTKIKLSTDETAAVRIDLGAGRVYERAVTRGELETMIAPLVERTITCCKRALKDAQREMGKDAITCVVMVGGSTRIPLVRQKVAEFFGLEPYTALDPDQVVALGAAVQASVLSGATRSALLLDVIPLSLGIETVGGATAKIIMRNSTVPAKASETFSTSVDGQTSIKLNVLQGEREMAADCRSLGTFHLSGIPPMPAGIPQLRVEFLVDANGVLNVSAFEARSGKRAALQVVPNHGLSRAEVERIERESFKHAREDMQRHRVADLVANSKLDLHWIRRQFEKHAGLLSETERTALEAAIANLAQTVEAAQRDYASVDGDAFHHAKEALDRASMRLHEVSITASLKDQM